MSAGKAGRQDPKTLRHQVKDHHKKLHDKAKKNPCLALPAAPAKGEILWREIAHRHFRFRAECLWAEVLLDAEGFALNKPIRRYIVQFQRRDPANVEDTHVRRFLVAAHDNDTNDTVEKVVTVHHSTWSYRFRTRAEVTPVDQGNRSAWSEWSDWSKPDGTPPDPTGVTIKRASHGILLAWHPPMDVVDPEIVDRRIGYFIAALYVTDDPDVTPFDDAHLLDKIPHIHHGRHHRFHVDANPGDELYYYGWVRSVSTDDAKGHIIPATHAGNDSPATAPDIARPLWHRHVFHFTIPGAVAAQTYSTPDRVDDDYIVRRVSCAAHVPGSGGTTYFDIQVNGSTWVFNENPSRAVSLASGDHDAWSNDTAYPLLERGDHLRVVCLSTGSTPPEQVTIQVVCDRYDAGSNTNERTSTQNSGGGGGG